MKLSADTEAVVAYLQAYANNSLRKPGDLGVILELTAQHDAAEFANEIIFAGASLWRVYRIWKRLAPGQEGYRSVQESFAKSVAELRQLLERLLPWAPEEVYRRFQEVYLLMTQGAVRNLVDLAHDLFWLKQLQNDARHGRLPLQP